MRFQGKILTGVLLGVFLGFSGMFNVSPAMGGEATFIGVKGCAKCHKKEKQGKQFAQWKKTKHAKSYETLGTDKAKKAAAKIGVTGNPQKAEACLVCHTTGYGKPASAFGKKFKMIQGVQCEACHGAGSLYKKKSTMKKIYKELGPDKKGNSPTAKKTGLIVPDSKVCKQCHVQSISFNGKTYKNPSYKKFDFKKYEKKITHPIPKK